MSDKQYIQFVHVLALCFHCRLRLGVGPALAFPHGINPRLPRPRAARQRLIGKLNCFCNKLYSSVDKYSYTSSSLIIFRSSCSRVSRISLLHILFLILSPFVDQLAQARTQVFLASSMTPYLYVRKYCSV